MSNTLPPILDRAFRDAVRHDTRASYGLAADRIYSPGDGWGPLMFALAVYYNLDRRFRTRYLGASPVRFAATMRGSELRGADIRIRWKKTGARLAAPGDVDRPSDVLFELAALNMASQPSLLDQPTLSNWVIAHSGNPSDGLLTVHLAAPRLAGNGRVVAWHESVAVFDARRPHLDFPDLEAPGLPEPMDLPELEIDFLPDAPENNIDEAADGDVASGGE